MNKRAFTLIELLVVATIIGTLAAAAVLNFNKAQTNSAYASTKTTITTYAAAAELYKQEKGYYPNDRYASSTFPELDAYTATGAKFVDAWGSGLDWNNICGSNGVYRGVNNAWTDNCLYYSDTDPGEVNIYSAGPDKGYATGSDNAVYPLRGGEPYPAWLWK